MQKKKKNTSSLTERIKQLLLWLYYFRPKTNTISFKTQIWWKKYVKLKSKTKNTHKLENHILFKWQPCACSERDVMANAWDSAKLLWQN